MHYSVPVLASPLDPYLLPCLTKQLLGFPCPGCGLQRAVLLLLQGEFLAAFYMYPALYPLILFVVHLATKRLFKTPHSTLVTTLLASVTVGTVLVAYLLKLTMGSHV